MDSEYTSHALVQVEEAKEALSGVVETDKRLERDFRRSVVEGAMEPINQDTMKVGVGDMCMSIRGGPHRWWWK